MGHYKTFGQSAGESFAPQQQQRPQMTSIEHLTFEDTPETPMRAIRHNQVRQTSHMPINEPFERENYHQPEPQQHQLPPQQIIEPVNMMDMMSCKMIMAHINACQLCKRVYQRDNNMYITIIALLLIFSMFLLSKLLDRK